MNEQQLADLFSEQLDQLLLGKEPVISSEATDLQELLGLGQQFSQVEFQLSSAGQVAFQSQVTTWFGSGGTSTAVISKTWLMGIVLVVVAVGSGIGLILPAFPVINSLLFDTGNKPETTAEPIATPNSSEMSDSDTETTELTIPNNHADTPTTNFQGDIVPAATSSQGDTLPTVSSVQETPSPKATFSLKDSLSIPVEGATEPQITTVDGEIEGTANEDGEPVNGGSSENSGSESSGSGSVLGEDDRGHGNDADGFDEDNPGNSLGIDNLGRGGENSGGAGNGQQGGNDKDDKGSSGNKGGGKGKGKDK